MFHTLALIFVLILSFYGHGLIINKKPFEFIILDILSLFLVKAQLVYFIPEIKPSLKINLSIKNLNNYFKFFHDGR